MKLLAQAGNPTLALLQEIGGAIPKTQAKIDRVAGEIVDLRTRIDGNTLILNRVAGYVQDHETRIVHLEKS